VNSIIHPSKNKGLEIITRNSTFTKSFKTIPFWMNVLLCVNFEFYAMHMFYQQAHFTCSCCDRGYYFRKASRAGVTPGRVESLCENGKCVNWDSSIFHVFLTELLLFYWLSSASAKITWRSTLWGNLNIQRKTSYMHIQTNQ